METKNVSDRVIKHVMTVADEEFADLSVSRLAYSFKINRFKLSRQFKRQAGKTMEDFLFKEKMARAAFLLKSHGNITVKEVAERSVFCTSDYFIRKFWEYYGIVPGKYKELKTKSSRKLKKPQRHTRKYKERTAPCHIEAGHIV